MSRIAFLSGGRRARFASLSSATLVAALASAPVAGAATIDFSDLTLAASSYYDGGPATNSAGWTSGGASFNNSVTNWGGSSYSWAGFAYSNQSDTTTPGYGNQYSAYNLGASTGTYALGYYSTFDGYAPTVSFGGAVAPQSVWLTNSTWAALSMRDGDSFAKKFGGATGDDADYFKVIITGRDGANQVTGTVEFYLADFRFADNAQDYIVDEWTPVDLEALGVSVESIEFYFESSDSSAELGIKTPTYIAIDNLSFAAVPEPSTAAALVGLGALALTSIRRRRRAVAAA